MLQVKIYFILSSNYMNKIINKLMGIYSRSFEPINSTIVCLWCYWTMILIIVMWYFYIHLHYIAHFSYLSRIRLEYSHRKLLQLIIQCTAAVILHALRDLAVEFCTQSVAPGVTNRKSTRSFGEIELKQIDTPGIEIISAHRSHPCWQRLALTKYLESFINPISFPVEECPVLLNLLVICLQSEDIVSILSNVSFNDEHIYLFSLFVKVHIDISLILINFFF